MPRVFLLLIVLVVAVTACAAPSEDRAVQESSDGRFEQVAVEGVQIWRSAQGSGDFLDAEVAGTVGYDEECGAFLHDEEFDLRYPVVWPASTEIDRTGPLTIRLLDNSTVEVGESVSGGGGYHSDMGLFPEGCAASGETAVFNASGDITVTADQAGSGPATPTPTQSPAAPAVDASHTPIPVPTKTAPPEGACGPQSTGTIQFADVLILDGRTYHAVAPDRGPTEVSVGPLHATTSCRLADGAPANGEPTPDGAAAYLAPGTPIHEFNGHATTFRLLALTDDAQVLYQSLAAPPDGRVLAALESAVTVDFVGQGTSQSLGTPSVSAQEIINALQEGQAVTPAHDGLLCSDRVNLSVRLSDGSTIGAVVYPAAGVVALQTAEDYISLSPAIIEALVAEAPTEAISPGSYGCD